MLKYYELGDRRVRRGTMRLKRWTILVKQLSLVVEQVLINVKLYVYITTLRVANPALPLYYGMQHA